MKLNNFLIFLILLFSLIILAGCQPATAPKQTSSSALLPSWISGQPGSVDLTSSAGNPPYKCAVTAGALPEWLKLNGCVLSGQAPVLAGGTTKSLSPEFTVTVTDSTGKQQNLGLIVTISTSIPAITFNAPGICIANQKCSINLINQVTGGTPPYHFQSDTFRNGAPPLGMIVDIDGILTGKPSRAGRYTFGVCVVDVVSVSKCGQTAVIVEEEEYIPKSNENGFCSSNAQCSSFGAAYCSGSENVRCGKDKFCHCCLNLCPGGENCMCIGCSTGCGGGTYCEGDVCVFNVGGSPSGEQTTESGVAVPEEESKDAPETWDGTLTGSEDKNTYCVEGKFSYNFNVKFKTLHNLVSAMQGKGKHISSDDEDNHGSISGTANVASQRLTSDYHTDCKLVGGALTDIPIKIRSSGFSYEGDEPKISIESPNYQNFIPSKVILDGNDVTPDFGSLILKPTSVSDTTISGTWGTSQFGESTTVPHGTFTITKQ